MKKYPRSGAPKTSDGGRLILRVPSMYYILDALTKMRIAIIFSYFQTGIIKSKKSPDADSNCDISTGSESPIINISHTKLGIVQDVQANSSNSMLKKGHSSLKRPALYFMNFWFFLCILALSPPREIKT